MAFFQKIAPKTILLKNKTLKKHEFPDFFNTNILYRFKHAENYRKYGFWSDGEKFHKNKRS